MSLLQNRKWSVALLFAWAAVAVSPAAAQLDDIVILHNDPGSATNDGAISLLDADSLATSVTAPAITDPTRGMFRGDGRLGVQSDNTIVSLVNPTDDPNTPNFETDNGIYARRLIGDLLPIGDEEGFGVPVITTVIYNDGAGFQDFVFIGLDGLPGVISNTQTRLPDLSNVAQAGVDGLNGGPGQFGDGPIGDAAMNSGGDLIFTYEFSTQPVGSQGRIRRQAGGDLAAGAGDEGLGEQGGNSILGTVLDIRSDDFLVLAKSSGIVELRSSNANLTPAVSLGGQPAAEYNTGQALGGAFADDVTAIGVLSDDRVVVGLANGELHLFSDNLRTQIDQRTLGAAIGDFNITSIGVQSDNDIVVGTEEGSLFLVDTTLADKTTPLTGLGRIADIALLSGPGGFFDADFDEDGDVDGDDFLLWQIGFGTGITSGAMKMDGDYDNDGDVDGDDFLGWQVEFPSPGDGTGAGAVPEPGCFLLVTFSLLSLVLPRIRRLAT